MRHVSGTHRVALDWLFNGINLDLKIQIKCVDIKKQMTDLWTKGSFTRDEWNNFLHLLDIMNLSTFSRSHFFQTESRVLWCRKDPKKVFRTIRRRWRRSQERLNLVSYRNLFIARQNSQNATEPFGWVTEQTNRPPASGDRRRETQVEVCLCVLKRSHKESQVKKGSEHSEWNVSSPSFGRPLRGTRNQESSELPGREHDCSSSFGRPLRGTRTQENRTNPELCNMEVTNTEYNKKVFQNLQNKLAGVHNLPEFEMKAYKTNILMWRWFVVSSMKAAVHVDPKVWTYPRIWVWSYWEYVQCHQEIDNGRFRNTKCEMSGLYEPFMDEFHVARNDRQKMDEDKSMCLLGFGILLGKDSYFKGSNCTMERPGGNSSSWEFFQWVIGMDGEPIEFEWKNFPRIHSIGNSSQNSIRNNSVIESSSCPCSMT